MYSEIEYFFTRDRDAHEGLELRAKDYFTGSRADFIFLSTENFGDKIYVIEPFSVDKI